MGNICRSPTAHGVFRALVQARNMDAVIEIDSAGTHAYHAGEPPDRRAQSTAIQRGIDLSDLRARPVKARDFELYDYIRAVSGGGAGQGAAISVVRATPEASRSA